jgi:hypothetical protein
MRSNIIMISLVAAIVLVTIALVSGSFKQPSEKIVKDEQSVATTDAVQSTEQPAQTQAADEVKQTDEAKGTTEAAPAAKDNGANATTSNAANASLQPMARIEPLKMAHNAAQQADGQKVNAQDLVAQVRAALGGEEKLKGVQGFSVNGDFRRANQNQNQSGTVSLDFLLPDKFKRTETMAVFAGIELTIVKALNGDQVWSDSKSGASNAQVMVMQTGKDKDQSTQLQDLRMEFARDMLAFLMTPPSSMGIEFSYAGEAKAPDGTADVLDAKGANGFAARLYIDKSTHRPLMMTYRGLVPRTSMTSTTAGSGGGVNKDDIDKLVKEAQAKAGARQEGEIQLVFADYKPVNGIMFPHKLTKAVANKAFEEWELSKFKINPPDLKPQKFEKK